MNTPHDWLTSEQSLRLAALELWLNFIGGISAAMCEAGNGPWIPSRGQVESMALDFSEFVTTGVVPEITPYAAEEAQAKKAFTYELLKRLGLYMPRELVKEFEDGNKA